MEPKQLGAQGVLKWISALKFLTHSAAERASSDPALKQRSMLRASGLVQ